MDRCSSGEIETTHDVRPASGIPCPTCYGVIDDCGPDKDENEERPKAATFCDGTDGDGGPRRDSVMFVKTVKTIRTYVIAANIS